MVERDHIMEMYRRRITPELYTQIRRLWKDHSIAEDSRDIPGLMATLTDDCVYTIVGSPYEWVGHEGATKFYTDMLGAIPDIHFDLLNIVIGPQGVFEEAQVTGTFENDWLHYKAHGGPLAYKVVIFFPWDMEKELFSGERVYVDSEETFLNPPQ